MLLYHLNELNDNRLFPQIKSNQKINTDFSLFPQIQPYL